MSLKHIALFALSIYAISGSNCARPEGITEAVADFSKENIQYKVVSLQKSEQRRKLMKQQMDLLETSLDSAAIGSRSKIAWDWIDAVDGSDTSSEVQKAVADGRYAGGKKPGEIGLLLTTADKVVPAALNFDGLTVILEDDVIIRSDLDFQLRTVLAAIPPDWEILYLGCNLNYWANPDGNVRSTYFNSNYLFDNSFTYSLCPENEVVKIAGTAVLRLNHSCTPGTWGYALNQRSAQKLNDIIGQNSRPFKQPIDEMIRRHTDRKLSTYCINPELVHHRDDLQSIIR